MVQGFHSTWELRVYSKPSFSLGFPRDKVYRTLKLLAPGPTPVNSLGDPDTPPLDSQEPGPPPQSMGSCPFSLCPMCTGEAGTFVGLWAIKGKAWVRRRRNGFGGGARVQVGAELKPLEVREPWTLSL